LVVALTAVQTIVVVAANQLVVAVLGRLDALSIAKKEIVTRAAVKGVAAGGPFQTVIAAVG